jgi:hypothetical protein
VVTVLSGWSAVTMVAIMLAMSKAMAVVAVATGSGIAQKAVIALTVATGMIAQRAVRTIVQRTVLTIAKGPLMLRQL